MDMQSSRTVLCGLAAAGIFAATVTGYASTWYVDDDNYGKSDLDGLTEATAFGTIQDALGNAGFRSGDTVMVLPGVYSNGVAVGVGDTLTRVAINKEVKLISKEGKDVTHIVGAPDPDTGTWGTNAVRCMSLSHYATDSIIKGFTIRNGYTPDDTGTPGRGGGIFVNNKTTWIIDCVISNCVSAYAAVFSGITGGHTSLYRSWITGNSNTPSGSTSAGYSLWLHTCLVSGNQRKSGSLTINGKAVNTTFAVNESQVRVTEMYNSIVSGGESANVSAENRFNSSYNNEYQLIAPFLNDFRVRAGGPADGTGDIKWLVGEDAVMQLPEGEELTDFHGNPYPGSGPIHMGCIQETVEAKGGRLQVAAGDSVDGHPAQTISTYLFPTSYPCQYSISRAADDSDLACYYVSAERNWRMPEPDGTLTVMPPPLTGGQYGHLSVGSRAAERTLHVEMPENGGDDATGDGSAEKPFATIQKAVDTAEDGEFALVKVGPGTYGGAGDAHYPVGSDGTAVTNYGRASVTVNTGKRIRILAVEGPEKTVLRGVADPEYADAETLPGCGTNAAKCIIFLAGDTGCGIQGFTLTEGHSTRAKDPANTADRAYLGGAWYSVSGYACISDCIVSNNVASVYAAGAAGVLNRLYVTGNHGSGVVGHNPLRAVSCFFENNPSASSAYGVIGADSRAYNCTIVESDADARVSYNIASARLMNSIAVAGQVPGSSADIANMLVWGCAAPSAADGYVYADPLFADSANGDYRVKSLSPATRIGGWDDSYYYQYASLDFAGDRIFSADGSMVLGAFAEVVDSNEVYIKADQGGVAVTGGDLGLNIMADETICLVPTNGPRPCIGYLVNGMTNLFADLPEGRLTVTPGQAEASGGVYVEMLYDNNWHVDAVNGDDDAPGFLGMPKRTLAAIMPLAVSGDIVNAAPGDYNEGLMGQDSTCVISSRVVVTSGVLLKSVEGPETTFISGADATIARITSSNYNDGCGSNAVRCVYLNYGSIRGFTVRNGRALGKTDFVTDTHSGGIVGRNAGSCFAYDCIITNCFGYRGGAMISVTAVDCLVKDCKAANGTIGRSSAFLGCVFDNSGDFTYLTGEGLKNCTFIPGATGTIGEGVTDGSILYNSIITIKIAGSESAQKYLRNCVILEGCISADAAPYVHLENCIVTNAEAIALMEDGRLSAGSCAIDAGNNSLVPDGIKDGDFADGQRIYNGTVDIGAYEFDWRKSYADTVHPLRCTVSNASPEVVQGEGKVLVGGTLETVMAGPGSGRRYLVEIPVNVTGNGVLDIISGDETLSSYSLSDGAQTFSYVTTADARDLSFVYTPGESDTGCAEIGNAMQKTFAFALVIR